MAFSAMSMAPGGLPAQVKIVEVSARDGLQNESTTLDPATRIALIHRLVNAGVQSLEVGAFVSGKWMPQMANTDAVLEGLERKEGVTYSVLVPDMRGFEQALAHGCKEIAVFAAASEDFSQRNINCSVAESLERIGPVVEEAKKHGMRVRGYVSCAMYCPYSGAVPPQRIASLASALWDMGCYEISLGDTTGAGMPAETRRMIEACVRYVPIDALAGHFHDTYGMASANVYASLQSGISVFDSSVAGLGGCPNSPGASGNIATEDLVCLLQGLGIETGLDLDALLEAGDFICSELEKDTASRAGRAYRFKRAEAGHQRVAKR